MTSPTPEEMAVLLARLTRSGWVSKSALVKDLARQHPMNIEFTRLGELRMRTLFQIVEELGRPEPSDGECAAFLALVIAVAGKNPG